MFSPPHRHRSADHHQRHGDPHLAAHPRDAGGFLPVPGVRLQHPCGGGSRPYRRAGCVSPLQQHPQPGARSQPLSLFWQTDGESRRGRGVAHQADCLQWTAPYLMMRRVIISDEVMTSIHLSILFDNRSKFKSLRRTCQPVRRHTQPLCMLITTWWIKCSRETESTSRVRIQKPARAANNVCLHYPLICQFLFLKKMKKTSSKCFLTRFCNNESSNLSVSRKKISFQQFL